MTSTKILAVATVGAAALLSTFSVAPAMAQPGSATVDHWGAYTGSAGNTNLRPVSVSLSGPVAEVGTSNSTEYALLNNGTLWAWGTGSDGQLGNGTLHGSASPVQFFPPNGVTYATLATSGATSYAVSTRGVVYAWGDNGEGQVGDGGDQTAQQPVAVDFGATAISATANDVAVSVGNQRESVAKP